jgi:hypothetical protein
MLHLPQQGPLLLKQLFGVLQQPLFLLLAQTARGDVLDREQDHPAAQRLVTNGQSIELDRALAEAGEVLVELEPLDRRVLRNHRLEQPAQTRNVPLAAGKLEQ